MCAYKIPISNSLLFDSLTETKQILITGFDDQAWKMELLERNGSSTICQASSFKYPIDVEYASGALVGTTMVSCGGYGDGTTYDSCYKFDKQNNQWTFLSKMSSPRSASAAISMHNGVWITGGYDGDNDLSSTEFIFLNGTKKDGPSLPQPRSYHCLAQYKGTIILTGGWGGERSIGRGGRRTRRRPKASGARRKLEIGPPKHVVFKCTQSQN